MSPSLTLFFLIPKYILKIDLLEAPDASLESIDELDVLELNELEFLETLEYRCWPQLDIFTGSF